MPGGPGVIASAFPAVESTSCKETFELDVGVPVMVETIVRCRVNHDHLLWGAPAADVGA